jgi:hypothetical protein
MRKKLTSVIHDNSQDRDLVLARNPQSTGRRSTHETSIAYNLADQTRLSSFASLQVSERHLHTQHSAIAPPDSRSATTDPASRPIRLQLIGKYLSRSYSFNDECR